MFDGFTEHSDAVPVFTCTGMLTKRGLLISGEASNIFPEMSQNVSKEIEDEANSYFQRIYNHPPHPTLSIDEVLEMLKKFQDSPNKRERVSSASEVQL
jgi:hypothetical protein